MSTQEQAERETLRTIQVRDPNGHRSIFLEGLTSSVTIAEIRARAKSALRLTEEVDWNVRDERSGRLLQEDQRLAELTNSDTQVTLRMQPDAGLG